MIYLLDSAIHLFNNWGLVLLWYWQSCSNGFFHLILFYSLSRQLEDLKQFVFILLIFIIAYGIALQAVSFPGPGKFQRGFWEVLRGIVDLPYWQMYGELFLEEISGNCPGCCRSGWGGRREGRAEGSASILEFLYWRLFNNNCNNQYLLVPRRQKKKEVNYMLTISKIRSAAT